MHDVVGRQIPHDSLVLHKIIRLWCMAPIKKKAESQREAFRCGRLAEPQIEGSIPHFIIQHSNNTISIVSIAGVGLMRYSHALIASVSPDGMGILRCTQSDSFPDSAKLVPLISRNTDSIHANIQHGLWFMCSIEYNHKSSIIMTSRDRNIVSEHMAGKNLKILDLRFLVDRDALKLIIPGIDYRLQVMHKQVI